jgi:hypothetical protein
LLSELKRLFFNLQGVGLIREQLGDPFCRSSWISQPQIRLTAEKDQSRLIAGISLQPFIQQRRRLSRTFVVQQLTHQRPAVILHQRECFCQLAQNSQPPLGLDSYLVKSLQVPQG